MKHFLALFALGIIFGIPVSLAAAKDAPTVLVWPPSGQPVIRFTFGKLRQTSSSNGNNVFASEVVAENVWDKALSKISFNVYFFDKSNVRIGDGYMDVSNLPAKQTVKFALDFMARGTPASYQIQIAQAPPELQALAPPKSISLTVYSVPPGATLAVDGKAAGITPSSISVTPGKHALVFSKEGFRTGTFPIEIGAEQLSGGNVTYELAGLAHDTIELRDGTTLTGDLESVSATTVELRIGGKVQSFDRNLVKRILLVTREAPQQ